MRRTALFKLFEVGFGLTLLTALALLYEVLRVVVKSF